MTWRRGPAALACPADFFLDPTPDFDLTDPEPVPDFDFDQSVPHSFEDSSPPRSAWAGARLPPLRLVFLVRRDPAPYLADQVRRAWAMNERYG